jgi:hypothetical protein
MRHLAASSFARLSSPINVGNLPYLRKCKVHCLLEELQNLVPLTKKRRLALARESRWLECPSRHARRRVMTRFSVRLAIVGASFVFVHGRLEAQH